MSELIADLRAELSSAATRRIELLHSVVELLPDALILVDSDGVIILVNAQAEIMFGYHRSELLGKAVEMLLPEALHAAHIAHRAAYSAAPRIREMGANLKLNGRTKTGAEFPLSIMLAPVVTTEGRFTTAVVRRA